MPSTIYLILSEVEGRAVPMQCSKIVCMPKREAGIQATARHRRWLASLAGTMEMKNPTKPIALKITVGQGR